MVVVVGGEYFNRFIPTMTAQIVCEEGRAARPVRILPFLPHLTDSSSVLHNELIAVIPVFARELPRPLALLAT